MEANELIKALECCFVKEYCTECPNDRQCRKDCCDATRKGFAQMGIDLLKHQQAEIDRLQKSNVVRCKNCEYLRIINDGKVYAKCLQTGFEFMPCGTDIEKHYCAFGKQKKINET